MGLLALTIDGQTLLIGGLTGLAYALLGVGLVLVFRATRVINFAYGEMGAFGAAVLAKLVLDYRWNFFLALAAMMAMGGLIGAIIELMLRRLFGAPRLIVLVATIGVAQILFFAQAILPDIDRVARYPSPIDRSIDVGDFLLRGEHFMIIAFVPAIVVGLVIFLNQTPYGIAIRAAAENADAAELAAISPKRVSTLVWILAGVLSTLTAILINPVRGTVVGLPSVALGPGLLLRALAAGLVGRLVSLPLVLAGGIGLGMVEAVLFVNVRNPGAADGMVFAIVVALVLIRARRAADEAGTWALTPRAKAVPERLLAVNWVRWLPHIAAGVCLLIAIALPQIFTTSARLFLFSRVLLFAIVALSVTVITGWAGQLSLCQFALVGIGSMTTATLVARGMPFAAAVGYATVAGIVVALAIGGPALRIRGLYLAVTTLGFAVMARGWLFGLDVFVGESTVVTIPRGDWGPIDLRNPRVYYYLCLIALILAIFVTARLRRSGIGRTLIAVRENDAAAAAFTVSPAVAKLSAFAVAGGLAAFAGALLGGLRVQFGADAFGVEESLRAVAMAIIGGLGTVLGPVLGAVYVVGLPAFFGESQEVRLLTSGVGMLILLLYLPGGLIQLVYKARDVILAQAEKRLPATAAAERPAALPVRARPEAVAGNGEEPARFEVPPEVPALDVREVSVRFGGVHALEAVSIAAHQGEIVGLIGSNGAGKSTLMNVVGGFLPAGGGRVEMLGLDITHLPPHERARLGMGRVFQDARLFGDLTVRESIQVALEARQRSELVPSLLAMKSSRRAEQRKAADAAELVAFLGLGRYADVPIANLSTGTRRITELACQLALDARVLLLDEPTAGVAQRETEAFAPLIRRVQAELRATLLIIEHDIPLVTSISDRMYCLGAGQVIAEGSPDQVRRNPAVIAAYLGTDERAIARSGAVAVALGEDTR